MNSIKNLLQLASDWWLELQIRKAANKDMNIPANWARFVNLVNARSHEQVEKMESERGLNANR